MNIHHSHLLRRAFFNFHSGLVLPTQRHGGTDSAGALAIGRAGRTGSQFADLPARSPWHSCQGGVHFMQPPRTPARRMALLIQALGTFLLRTLPIAQRLRAPVQRPLTFVQSPLTIVQRALTCLQLTSTAVQRALTCLQLTSTAVQRALTCLQSTSTVVQRPFHCLQLTSCPVKSA